MTEEPALQLCDDGGRDGRRRRGVRRRCGGRRHPSSPSRCWSPSRTAAVTSASPGLPPMAPRSARRSGSWLGIAIQRIRSVGSDPRSTATSPVSCPEARGTGIGRAIKLHQREWAAANGIATIVWTFDPLVRRNAWFNIAVLGADVYRVPALVLRDDDRRHQRRRRLRPACSSCGTLDRPLPDGAPRRPRRRGAGRTRADTRRHRRAPANSDPLAVAVWRSRTRTALDRRPGRRTPDRRIHTGRRVCDRIVS